MLGVQTYRLQAFLSRPLIFGHGISLALMESWQGKGVLECWPFLSFLCFSRVRDLPYAWRVS